MMIGNLTADPELRYTASGTAVCNFRIAVNEKYGDREEVLYLRVVAWGKVGENASQYLSKGQRVFVEGRLTERKWESDSGTKYITELVAQNVRYLSGKQDSQGKSDAPPEEITDIEPF
jgi:single-strand DNA-binding protein